MPLFIFLVCFSVVSVLNICASITWFVFVCFTQTPLIKIKKTWLLLEVTYKSIKQREPFWFLWCSSEAQSLHGASPRSFVEAAQTHMHNVFLSLHLCFYFMAPARRNAVICSNNHWDKNQERKVIKKVEGRASSLHLLANSCSFQVFISSFSFVCFIILVAANQRDWQEMKVGVLIWLRSFWSARRPLPILRPFFSNGVQWLLQMKQCPTQHLQFLAAARWCSTTRVQKRIN